MTRKFALGIRPTVGQSALRVLPDSFIRVELGGIARETVEVEPGIARLQGAEGFAAVDRAVVPDHDHGAAKMAEQVPQEGADLRLSDVVEPQREVQSIASASGTHREAGDDGDPIATLAMAKQGRVAPRRPGTTYARDQEEPRFVDEDEVGPQPRGFFLMCGQVARFQRAIRFSSRSSARRSGFCTLHPRACISRPT